MQNYLQPHTDNLVAFCYSGLTSAKFSSYKESEEEVARPKQSQKFILLKHSTPTVFLMWGIQLFLCIQFKLELLESGITVPIIAITNTYTL